MKSGVSAEHDVDQLLHFEGIRVEERQRSCDRDIKIEGFEGTSSGCCLYFNISSSRDSNSHCFNHSSRTNLSTSTSPI